MVIGQLVIIMSRILKRRFRMGLIAALWLPSCVAALTFTLMNFSRVFASLLLTRYSHCNKFFSAPSHTAVSLRAILNRGKV